MRDGPPSIPRTPACRRSRARSRRSTDGCTTSSSTRPRSSSSPPPACRRSTWHPFRARPRRRGDRPSPAWPNGAAIVAVARDADRRAAGAARASATRSTSTPSRPRSRRARGCCSHLAVESARLGRRPDEQQPAARFLSRRRLWLVADEVYERLYYAGDAAGEPAPSILRLCTRDDLVQVVQSFSKTYCMTGWRVGWLVTRADLGPKLAQLNEFFVSHAATFVQVAALWRSSGARTSWRGCSTPTREARFLRSRSLRELPGVTLPAPDGAFYRLPTDRRPGGLVWFCRRLLLEQRVGLAPARRSGPGERVRSVSATRPSAVLEPALERFATFLRVGW